VLRERSRGLRIERRDARGPLAGSRLNRSANVLRREYGLERWTGACRGVAPARDRRPDDRLSVREGHGTYDGYGTGLLYPRQVFERTRAVARFAPIQRRVRPERRSRLVSSWKPRRPQAGAGSRGRRPWLASPARAGLREEIQLSPRSSRTFSAVRESGCSENIISTVRN